MRTGKLIALSGCCLSFSASALMTSDFTFESGSDSSNYSAKGKPVNTYSVAETLPQDVLSNVYSMLPEGTLVNSAFIAPERYSSIDIDEELNGAEFATAKVTFLNEGAGYRNTLGYFVFDTNNPPTSKDEIAAHVIIFPNTSKAPDGEMEEGDTIDLNVQLTAGQTLAFFIIPNGWGWSGSYNNIASLGSWGTPFYSYSNLNPESTSENRRHNVAFIDTQNEFLVLGFEDIYRPDGDYDFNDVVWRYRVTELLNGQREIKNITFDYTLQAMGAGFSNGFAVHLPNVNPANIASTVLTRNGEPVTHQVVQSGGEAVLVVSENLRKDLEALGELDSNCTFYRTQTACVSQQTSDVLSYQLTVELSTPVSREQVGYPPYDSFIFASKDSYHGDFTATPPGMSWQTHFKSFAGTSEMNNSFFNLHDDNSGGAESFLTNNNMPWAINIRDEWDHPIENVDISKAYPDFPTWVTSSGESETTWYQASTANKVIPATQQ
ncbi:TPA: LruC domain-containing protein [Vibrio parahaemolyticus]